MPNLAFFAEYLLNKCLLSTYFTPTWSEEVEPGPAWVPPGDSILSEPLLSNPKGTARAAPTPHPVLSPCSSHLLCSSLSEVTPRTALTSVEH